MHNRKPEFRPITVPQFVADSLNIYDSEECENFVSQAIAHERISNYLELLPEGSWIIRSIKLLLDEHPQMPIQAK